MTADLITALGVYFWIVAVIGGTIYLWMSGE